MRRTFLAAAALAAAAACSGDEGGGTGGGPGPTGSATPGPTGGTPGPTASATPGGTPSPSPSAPPQCDAPECGPPWSGECSGDASQARLCGVGDDGCPAWGAWKSCGDGRTCNAGECGGGCASEADLIFIVDRTSAVSQPWWDATHEALERGYDRIAGAARMGIRTAPGPGACQPSPTVPAAPASEDNRGAFTRALVAPGADAELPLAEALSGLDPAFGSPDAEETVVVLAAGPPGCAGRDEALLSVRRLRRNGVDVHFISLGAGREPSLEALAAEAGTMLRVPAAPGEVAGAIEAVQDTLPLCCVDHDEDDRGPYCPMGGDCDDADPAVHDGAAETCNERDDDCDGSTDEDATGPCGPCCPIGQRCLPGPPAHCASSCCSTAECDVGQLCGLERAAADPVARVPLCIESVAGRGLPVGSLCSDDDLACQSSICHGGLCREACCEDADCQEGLSCRPVSDEDHVMFGTGLKICERVFD